MGRGVVAKILFWGSLAALLWTHAGYPLAAAALARLRRRPVRKADVTPSVTLIVAAHDEEAVIGRLLESILALDYPPDRLGVVVVSDGSTDRTGEIVEGFAAREPRVRLVARKRSGKSAAQDAAVAGVGTEIVAFSDANAVWAPDALRNLVRSFADPDVAYVCGRLVLEEHGGTSRERAYWRYELWLREQESALGSITAGNGAIYAVRRESYVSGERRMGLGHDFGFPYLMVQRGKRAVYEPAAVVYERTLERTEDEFDRKVRMISRSWRHVLSGHALRRSSPLFLWELFSHRVLRYSSGVLHLVLLGATAVLIPHGLFYELALAAQLAWLVLAVAGKLRLPIPGAALAWYYLAVTAATVVGLARSLRGAPVVWEPTEGTR
jgi:cellulose synthase/poly-beta-1,6-N-acetylglucosamine synthase-like glycosyltransferase